MFRASDNNNSKVEGAAQGKRESNQSEDDNFVLLSVRCLAKSILKSSHKKGARKEKLLMKKLLLGETEETQQHSVKKALALKKYPRKF
ncbi:CLUMA_CG017103, isoform A [Clunio marinus]|uniref:CLUMA_CG017103, isoform A n=1 Tax=Clunio marinus TaxID=568069 RepID=A0A1J1IV47_9DIPT|nr:CLUMA_CG017103, isoform A [Clunio marinus]